MRVAVVGGTGSFGQAVAKRLVGAGVEVVIGSRDAERARAVAKPLGAEGANNDDAVQRADLVLFAVKADAAVESARELRQSIGSTPVFSVCAELTFGPGGVKPTSETTSVAQRIQDELDAPSQPACTRSPLRTWPRRRRTRTRSSAATMRSPSSSRSISRADSSAAAPSIAAPSQQPARSKG